jgi:hypothetical protein
VQKKYSDFVFPSDYQLNNSLMAGASDFNKFAIEFKVM